jgi:integrase
MTGSNSLLFASPATGTEKGSVRHAMLRACARAEIEPYTIRDLRRTALTRAAEGGADTITISRMAGHTDIRLSRRYVKSDSLLQKASDGLVKTPMNFNKSRQKS